MSEMEQFDPFELGNNDDYRKLPGLNVVGRNGGGWNEPGGLDARPAYEGKSQQGLREVPARAVGTPLPMGSVGKSSLAAHAAEAPAGRMGVPPPGRALSVPPKPEADQTSGMQWAMGVMKQAVPFVQKLLPLLDGQIVTAVANLLAARPHTPQSAPKVDLAPLENSLTEIQVQHRDLKEQLSEQNASLKKVEDRLEAVREATDRNTLEQQELIEDLKTMGNRVNLLALLFLGLLTVSVLLNIFLFLHIQRVLP